MKHRKNSAAAAQRIRVKEVFLRQKELILVGETLLLATIGFDFNVQHPHKILIEAVKRLSLPNTVARVAWNYLNDWMQTTLYLQYKPHYLAAGSIYLAAKINNVRLPYDKGHIWWQEFDVLPRQLDEAVQHMMEVMGYKKSVAVLAAADKTTAASSAVQERQQSNSSESCISSQGGSSPMVEYVCDRRPTLIKQDRHPNGLFPNTNSSSACGRSELKRQYLDSKCNGGVIHNENLKFTSQKTGLDCQRNTNAILTMPIRVNMNSETGRPRENPKRRRLEKCEIDEQHTCPRHFLGKRAVV